MASSAPSLSVAELQRAALAEALRRSHVKGSKDGADGDEGASGIAALTLDEEVDPKELMYRLHEANAINEGRRRAIVENLHRLGKQEDSGDGAGDASGGDVGEDDREETLRAKEMQLARLDFEIEALERDASLPPNLPSIASSLVSRQALLSSIEQYHALVASCRQDLESETRALADDRKLREDLKRMMTGIGRAKERIEEANEQNTGEHNEKTLSNLRTHLSKTEASLSELLNTLIQTINSLFPDAMPADGEADASVATVLGGAGGQSKAEARKRAQLRALLDALMNRAWDHPGDPYVELNDPATGARIRRYPPQHVEFLIRADIALEHPRDARKIRLVGFQN